MMAALPASKLTYLFALILGKVSTRFLALLESQIQLTLGKGSGGHSTEQEVESLSQVWSKKFGSLQHPIIFDVGGNNGDWTTQAQRHFPHSKLYIFEPSERSFNILKSKFADVATTSVVKRALGDAPGFFPLYSDESGSPLSSLLKRNLDFTSLDFDQQEEVEVERLDDWCGARGIQPNILKLDIEGFELNALLGSRNTIRNTQLIQFEFGGANRDSRTYFKDFWDFFSKENFSLFRISPLGLIPISKYQEQDECFRTTNFIAVNDSFS